MEIVHYLTEMRSRIFKELADIEENIMSADSLYRIRKHILSFSSYENMQKKFFSHLYDLPEDRERAKFINLCETGNTVVWLLFSNLSEILSTSNAAAIRKAFSDLRTYEELHLLNTLQTYIPCLLNTVDAEASKRMWNEFVNSKQFVPLEAA
jgi:hypothetical protein